MAPWDLSNDDLAPQIVALGRGKSPKGTSVAVIQELDAYEALNVPVARYTLGLNEPVERNTSSMTSVERTDLWLLPVLIRSLPPSMTALKVLSWCSVENSMPSLALTNACNSAMVGTRREASILVLTLAHSKAAVYGGQIVAATVAGERRLIGIIKLDDGFLAASSVTRISTRDP